MIVAEAGFYVVIAYLGIGLIFAIYFVVRGMAALDEATKDTSAGFRFLIFWGAAAFWPLLLKRLLRGEKRPIEKNAHREAAG